MLRTRVISALVLAPLFLAVVYLGTPWFEGLFAIIAALMGWEWSRMTQGGKGTNLSGLVTSAALAIMVLLMMVHQILPAIGVIAVASLVVAFMEVRSGVGRGWQTIGLLYLALTLFSVVYWQQQAGWQGFVWLLAIVWATDTGAYFAGRSLGGPKLAPRISPNKTWSGLAGGMICACLASMLVIWAVDARFVLGQIELPLLPIWGAGILGACLAVVAQMGDLFESFVKRTFGFKDSSQIIPGHGGLLDRFDGLLAAAVPVVFLPAIVFITRLF